MQAVKGYLSDGQFTPMNGDVLPSRAQVIVIIEEVLPFDSKRKIEREYEARMKWLKRLHESVDDSMDEEPLDFPPRSREMRPPVVFED